MADRVVTVDLEAMLGGGNVRLLAATARPYNPTGLPGRWRGGYYVDAIVELDVGDASTLQPNTAEYLDDMINRVKDAGVGHTFLGWERLEFAPDPLPVGLRRTVITIDLGAAINARMNRLDTFPVTASSRALEILADVPGGNGSTLHSNAYDALDDHPGRLRDALARNGGRRRRRNTDPPIGWEQRRNR